jgi:hypothetical protein
MGEEDPSRFRAPWIILRDAASRLLLRMRPA